MNRSLSMVAMAALVCAGAAAEEPIVGLPCEGCEAVFEGMPGDLAAEARIAPEGEPGEPLVIDGFVRRADGSPAPGVVVYAYQTDASGIYPRATAPVGAAARLHGRLRSWAKSDAEGRFRFRTVRPGGYPSTTIPQHVHLHVLEPGRCTYYIDDLLFDDDPRLTATERRRLEGRGGSGIAEPRRDADGTWRARRDIVLGESVPGYERCGATPP